MPSMSQTEGIFSRSNGHDPIVSGRIIHISCRLLGHIHFNAFALALLHIGGKHGRHHGRHTCDERSVGSHLSSYKISDCNISQKAKPSIANAVPKPFLENLNEDRF